MCCRPVVRFWLVMQGNNDGLPAATLHQPVAVITTTTGSTAIYDKNGNMTTRVQVSGTQRIN
jgi:hypothetical protein